MARLNLRKSWASRASSPSVKMVIAAPAAPFAADPQPTRANRLTLTPDPGVLGCPRSALLSAEFKLAAGMRVSKHMCPKEGRRDTSALCVGVQDVPDRNRTSQCPMRRAHGHKEVTCLGVDWAAVT